MSKSHNTGKRPKAGKSPYTGTPKQRQVKEIIAGIKRRTPK